MTPNNNFSLLFSSRLLIRIDSLENSILYFTKKNRRKKKNSHTDTHIRTRKMSIHRIDFVEFFYFEEKYRIFFFSLSPLLPLDLYSVLYTRQIQLTMNGWMWRRNVKIFCCKMRTLLIFPINFPFSVNPHIRIYYIFGFNPHSLTHRHSLTLIHNLDNSAQ